MAKQLTPLMQQYYEIKQKHPNMLLLFRMGDFFETFDEDAKIMSKICGITLTKRNNGAAEASPLAGFPHHQLENYLPKLVKAGCRVAVCEQIEDPKKKSGPIVKREVIEVVTPGISMYDKLLDSNRNNYVCSIYLNGTYQQETEQTHFKRLGIATFAGVAYCDITTGEFIVGEIPISQLVQSIESYAPSEILYSKAQKNDVENILSKMSHNAAKTRLEDWIFEQSFSKELLLRHFQTRNFKGFGINDITIGISAAGVVLHYIAETQKNIFPQIQTIRLLTPTEYMLLDYSTRRNLEILHTMDGEANGSLIRLLDKTLTPMGARLLKKWLNHPLNHLEPIHFRLKVVECFVDNPTLLNNFNSLISNFGDMERILSRMASGKANTRDLVSLEYCLKKIPKIIELTNLVNDEKITTFKQLTEQLISLENIAMLIASAILEEPSLQFGNGQIFKPKYNEELDHYVNAKFNGKQWINEYQEKERFHTGIPSLKVSYNGVFGYYIEVTKTHTDKVPDNYNRKQTLTNAERYITKELSEFETNILNAEFKIQEIEQRLFNELKTQVLEHIEALQQNANILAELDCLQCFATVSVLYDYTKPEIDDSNVINITEGRHPVIERMFNLGEQYQPNSTSLTDAELIHIITGPNMAGKSCYLRQTALIILLGQIGCFVPAKKAHFGIIDRIFTRVGAQDNITAGESTFLVEMQEAAYILNNATNKSLILLDEVGRGTATFDGISIAWAITEYINNVIKAKTLFATHYHELNELTEQYEHIINYRAEVIETDNKIIFTHKFIKGASDHSFGIYVAKMAGIPKPITERAEQIMNELDQKELEINKTNPLLINKKTSKTSFNGQLSIFEVQDDAIRDKLRKININELTPVQAFQVLSEMSEML